MIAEQQLWCEVLHQWIEDIVAPQHLSFENRKRALEWLLDDTESGCSAVCQVVGLKYAVVKERVMRRLQGGGRG